MSLRFLPRPHHLLAFAALVVAPTVFFLSSAPPDAHARGATTVAVPKGLIHFDDGDTVTIRWPGKDAEDVRILGIDTPEVLHLDHDIPYRQPFGGEATGFLKGCVAVATKVELLRSGEKDKYGRTLGYLLFDGKNYSPLVIATRLAYGPNPKFGDNGLPKHNAACIKAADEAGPPPFEEPWLYRRRMRKVTKWMKANGVYPRAPEPEKK